MIAKYDSLGSGIIASKGTPLMASANLVLRFALELAGVAALAYYGFNAPLAAPLRWIAAIGIPVAFVAIWALVVAPNTMNGLTQAQKDVIGTVLLLAAAGALALAGQQSLAVGFAIAIIVNAILLFVFGQDARDAIAGGPR
jgi:Protein of unknown function (DUF2568)